jgi:hypothetical protein
MDKINPSAKWLLMSVNEGFKLTYHNLIDDIVFDCGFSNETDLDKYINFAVEEGGAAGDEILLDGNLICTILLNRTET